VGRKCIVTQLQDFTLFKWFKKLIKNLIMAYANYEQAARYLVGLTSAMRGYMSTLYGDFSKEKEEIRQLKKQEIHRPILADSLKTKVEYLKKDFFESNFSNFYSTVFGKEEKVSLLHYVYAKEELFKRLKKFAIADELGKILKMLNSI
jgi:hypothetical protein